MRESLKWSERMLVASMLFGMFFGAGNLIFPVYLGQMAGSNVWAATLGFLITGAGLPLLGVIPEDDALPLALNQGTPIPLADTACPASAAYRNIGIRLQGGKAPLLRIK